MRQYFTRFLLIFFALTLCTPSALAEPKEDHTAEMLKELQEFKIKYLIQEMDLSADKQAEFTKVYTQYENERAVLFHELHHKFKSIHKKSTPTDNEYMGAAESMAMAKAREGELEKKYFNRLKTILSPKQLYLLKRAERKFDRKLSEQRGRNGKKAKKK